MTKSSFDKNSFLRFAAIVAVSAALIFLARLALGINASPSEDGYLAARVVSVEEKLTESVTDSDGNEFVTSEKVPFTAKTLSKPEMTLDAVQYLDMALADERCVEVGDRVVVSPAAVGDAIEGTWLFVSYDRTLSACLLLVVFFVLIVLLGGKKGLRTVFSLALTAVAVFSVYLPALLAGKNVYLMTALTSIYIIVMSLFIIDGINKKTLCAVLGNSGGALLAAVLALWLGNVFKLNGVPDQTFMFLSFSDYGIQYDLRAIVWSGMVVGSLGAIMDVSMTIASAMKELSDNMENKTRARLIRSGMNIGRDAIGTMTNTLILAYIGCELGAVLLLASYNVSLLNLVNLEMMITEILRALAGSFGILLAVPVTVLSAALIFTTKAEPEFHIGHDV